MTNLIFNKQVVAFQRNEISEAGITALVPFETFGTEYGLFIPVTFSGYQFLRWIRKGARDVLPLRSIGSHLIHISNDGEVLMMHASTESNTISVVPVLSEQFQLLNASREISAAYSRLLRDCQTVAEACRFVEEHEVNGIPDPHIILVNDWVEYAKSRKYTRTFYLTKFRGNNRKPLSED